MPIYFSVVDRFLQQILLSIALVQSINWENPSQLKHLVLVASSAKVAKCKFEKLRHIQRPSVAEPPDSIGLEML